MHIALDFPLSGWMHWMHKEIHVVVCLTIHPHCTIRINYEWFGFGSFGLLLRSYGKEIIVRASDISVFGIYATVWKSN